MILTSKVTNAITVCDVKRELVIMQQQASSSLTRWNCLNVVEQVDHSKLWIKRERKFRLVWISRSFKVLNFSNWKSDAISLTVFFYCIILKTISHGCANQRAGPFRDLMKGEHDIVLCGLSNGSEPWIYFRCILWTWIRSEKRNVHLGLFSRFQCRQWHPGRDQSFHW